VVVVVVDEVVLIEGEVVVEVAHPDTAEPPGPLSRRSKSPLSPS
jgi:hypothetical protein